MKNYLSIIVIFAILLLAIPAITLFKEDLDSSSESNINSSINPDDILGNKGFKLLNISTQTITELSTRDYMIGSVFAQMPANFEEEALKCQAIIAHTYALRQHLNEVEAPSATLLGADFSNDTSVYPSYLTEEQARAYYGDNYEENFIKVSSAVDMVLNDIIIFEGEPIITAFHSISSGITESAKIAWNNEIPYLIAVTSVGDVNADGFIQEKVFTIDEINARLTQGFDGIILSEDTASWLKISERSPSGTVLKLMAGNIEIKGSELKELLTLRSSCFEINYDGVNFNISTKGFGHCVGLSQTGANAMAISGSNYKDILTHYFTGVEIKSIPENGD